jgi:hypothetical protein
VITEVIVAIVELVLGHIPGLSVAVTLFVAAHYLGKGQHLAGLFRYARVIAVVLAGLALFGALDIEILAGVLAAVVDLVAGLLR